MMRSWQQNQGSMTIEALLILPVVFLILALIINIGQGLYEDLHQSVLQQEIDEQLSDDSLPADWIRKTDLMLDWGRGLKELLPACL
jgi:hypothetical protein